MDKNSHMQKNIKAKFQYCNEFYINMAYLKPGSIQVVKTKLRNIHEPISKAWSTKHDFAKMWITNCII